MKMFDFDAEFRLGIPVVDEEHSVLVDLLNDCYSLMAEGNKDEARQIFNEILSAYVEEHFLHEELFMAEIGYPLLEEHRQVHANFKASFLQLKPLIESYDDKAFRNALNDTFTWIIGHIGRTDKKYAAYYQGN